MIEALTAANELASQKFSFAHQRQQSPYRCQSRNHGLCASISSCRRLAADKSLGVIGRVSGSVKIRSRDSISAMVCSASIPPQSSSRSGQTSNGSDGTVCRAVALVMGETQKLLGRSGLAGVQVIDLNSSKCATRCGTRARAKSRLLACTTCRVLPFSLPTSQKRACNET